MTAVFVIALAAGVSLTAMAVSVGVHYANRAADDDIDAYPDTARPGADDQWTDLATAMRRYRKHKAKARGRRRG